MYNKETLSETSQNIKFVQGKIHELLFQISLFRLILIESLAEFVMMNKYSKYLYQGILYRRNILFKIH